jgi:Domain of unknown function (DUF4349)
MPLDPEVAAALEAIDATLAGEPVDPARAELAELALLLRDERPQPSAALAGVLDARVERRFAPPARAARQRRPRRRWLWAPAGGLAAALAAAIVIAFATGSSPSGSSSAPSVSAVIPRAPAQQPHSAASASSAAGQPLSQSAPASPVLQPPANGRKIIQGGQLSLVTSSARIDDVAQEIFVVIGQVHGIVNSSSVTASGGPGGYAQFQLSIPSGSLPETMAELSSLRYARVTSRTDTTQDVTDQYQADVQRLGDARALRTSLLKQLANAVTQGQIDSLTAQIHDNESAIASDESTLRSLNHQIADSQVTVTINGGFVGVASRSGGNGSGLTFGRAAHDAGRVLTVAAGIALIGLAALLPIALIGAFAWWVASALRRRRREHALDLV